MENTAKIIGYVVIAIALLAFPAFFAIFIISKDFVLASLLGFIVVVEFFYMLYLLSANG